MKFVLRIESFKIRCKDEDASHGTESSMAMEVLADMAMETAVGENAGRLRSAENNVASLENVIYGL